MVREYLLSLTILCVEMFKKKDKRRGSWQSFPLNTEITIFIGAQIFRLL